MGSVALPLSRLSANGRKILKHADLHVRLLLDVRMARLFLWQPGCAHTDLHALSISVHSGPVDSSADCCLTACCQLWNLLASVL